MWANTKQESMVEVSTEMWAVGWCCGTPEETTPNSAGGAGLCKVGRSTHNRNEQRDVFQEEGPLG